MSTFLDSVGLSHFWSKLKSFFVKGNGRVFVGTCDTAAATEVKDVTCPDFTSSDLTEGTIISVFFSTTNSAGVAKIELNVNGTGAKNVKYIYNGAYSNIPAANYIRENQIYHFTYDGTYWVVQMMYNTNTNDASTGYLRYANGTFSPTTNLYRYMFCLTKDETQIIPVTAVSNSTGTSKALTTEEFDPFAPIYYYSTTATVNAGTAIGVGYLWTARADTYITYAFNCGSTLTLNKNVYIRATLTAPIKAKLATSNTIVQDLPTSDDGYIYIKLGHAYATNRVAMSYDHPVYIYKNGAVRTLSGYSDAAGVVNGHTVESDVPSGAKFTDTTYSLATSSSDGLLRKLESDTSKFLRSDGVWAEPPSTAIVSVTNRSGSNTLSTATWGSVGNVTLDEGIYIVHCLSAFTAASAGYRMIRLSASDASGTAIDNLSRDSRMPMSGSAATVAQFTIILSVASDASTYYLNAWQNSGDSLVTNGYICAVRIK